MPVPYSLLDLAPVPQGADVATALSNAVVIAQHAEDLGYRRVWYAEHHNTTGIASSATAVLIGHVAAKTERIRVGAGGIMLPNHSPLVIAEQFGTLATLFPERIDLGLGRAPGTDQRTMRALRRSGLEAERFPNDVVELLGYLGDADDTTSIRAVPGVGTHVPVWILGSSTFGAQLAAHLGLPYAFASHFAPAALEAALGIYRKIFQPSAHLDAPCFMLAVNVFAADTDTEARYIKTSMQLAFANLRRGRPGPLPRPVRDIEQHIEPQLLTAVDQALSVSAVGTLETVTPQLHALIAQYQPDELILTSHIHDQQARLRSLELAARALT